MKINLHSQIIPVIQQGHPWVFPKAIVTEPMDCAAGTLVDLFSSSGDLIARGIYNPNSLYRVRILATTIDPLSGLASLSDLVRYRLLQAIALRKQLNLPNAETTAFRLFNSEADGLSGLTIDQFNDTLVIASSAYWVEANKSLILECLMQVLPHHDFLWLPQIKLLKQEGWEQVLSEERPAKEALVKEAGVQFKVDFSNAQKTGLFLDQRDNHQRMACYAKDARVLDLYTYTGGFALHAAKANAASVLAVDSSAQAIERAEENARLNRFDQIHFTKGDARDYLQQAGNFDLVILDPPKLMPSMRHQAQAKNYYRFLHRELFKAMRPNTLFMSCNCSAAFNRDEFVKLIASQALAINKRVKILGIFGPAMCHPTLPHFPEGQYLTAVLGVVQ